MGTATTPVHPDIAPIEHLLGVWEGHGEGSYPTIEAFTYVERTVFSHDGRPFLFYEQRTWSADDYRPLHVESGMWKSYPDGRVEAVIAHTGGIAEVAVGTAQDRSVVELASQQILMSPSAKQITSVGRELRLDGGLLVSRLHLEAVGQPWGPHLWAKLRRVIPAG